MRLLDNKPTLHDFRRAFALNMLRNGVDAKPGEIAHHTRSMAHSGERENPGQRYCTSCVRHGPVSA